MTHETLEAQLELVRQRMVGALAETVLPQLIGDCRLLIGPGKMLRARLLLRLAPARNLPAAQVIPAAAAVELVHAASLLHDDVIDGGLLRRNLPAFWKERGVTGAILIGDLMLFKALALLIQTEDHRLVADLVQFTGEICNAEAEQELLSRGVRTEWERCVDIDRRKTGALFAFAAGTACGGDADLRAALHDAGYAIGTAYQLADDVLDVCGNESLAGKTLGRDRARQIQTAAAFPGGNAATLAAQKKLQAEACAALGPWPALQAALKDYLELDLNPALAQLFSNSKPDGGTA
jgi:geranylgeranyl pyrophosphate synthase